MIKLILLVIAFHGTTIYAILKVRDLDDTVL
jgi:hypothetical protein